MALPSVQLGSPAVFTSVLQTAREAGMDAASLAALCTGQPWRERIRIWTGLMRALRIDGFPVRVAQRYSVGGIGPLGMAAEVAPNLRGAFERLERYQHLLAGTALGRVHGMASRGAIHEILPLEGDTLGARCRREMIVASGLKFARDLAGVAIRPRRVCFRHAPPRDIREHKIYFACEVRFGADFDGLEFDAATLELPLPRADGDLSQFLDQHLRRLCGDEEPAASLEGRVRWAIYGRMGSRSLDSVAVARDLGMSARTLRRRLLEAGSHYQEILDRVRLELADDLLADTGHKVAEVALALGFADASAFHRAYVRWTGLCPSSRRGSRAD